MKRVLLAVYILTIVISIGVLYSYEGFALDKKAVTILFTHDMHDHFSPVKVLKNGKVNELGGFARLQSAINIERKLDNNLILVDAGDFSMGTLFQSIYGSDAPELRLMGSMGYDVVTLGNHEFDFRTRGITDSLNTCKNSGEKMI